jgi:hypothetical protein
LAISKQLAERMGGDITVSSEPGKGSVFLVRLPFGTLPAEQVAALSGSAAGIHAEVFSPDRFRGVR